jgi:hypothetical protein
MPSWTQVCITEPRVHEILDALRDRAGLRFFTQRSCSPAVMFYGDPRRVRAGGVQADAGGGSDGSNGSGGSRREWGSFLIWDTRLQPPPRLDRSQVGDFFVPGSEFIEMVWGRDSDHGDLGVFKMRVEPPSGLIRFGGEPVAIARELLLPTTEWIRGLLKRGTVSAQGQYMRVSKDAVQRLRSSAKRPTWVDALWVSIGRDFAPERWPHGREDGAGESLRRDSSDE